MNLKFELVLRISLSGSLVVSSFSAYTHLSLSLASILIFNPVDWKINKTTEESSRSICLAERRRGRSSNNKQCKQLVRTAAHGANERRDACLSQTKARTR